MAPKSEMTETMTTLKDAKMTELARSMGSFALEAARRPLQCDTGLEETESQPSTKTETTELSTARDEEMTARASSEDGPEQLETQQSVLMPTWMESEPSELSSEMTATT